MKTITTPKPILVLPTSTPRADVAAAVKSGYLPILTDTPEAVKVIAASNACWSADDVLLSAMEALQYGGLAVSDARQSFARLLWTRIKERRAQ